VERSCGKVARHSERAEASASGAEVATGAGNAACQPTSFMNVIFWAEPNVCMMSASYMRFHFSDAGTRKARTCFAGGSSFTVSATGRFCTDLKYVCGIFIRCQV
jgi:hypothetical protein